MWIKKTSDNYLIHYGIKGMRWRVRKPKLKMFEKTGAVVGEKLGGPVGKQVGSILGKIADDAGAADYIAEKLKEKEDEKALNAVKNRFPNATNIIQAEKDGDKIKYIIEVKEDNKTKKLAGTFKC